MRLDRELTCAQVVELVTAYLEQRLPEADTERFEEHLVFCDGCSTYLDQMRATIATAGALRREDVPAALKDQLLATFRRRGRRDRVQVPPRRRGRSVHRLHVAGRRVGRGGRRRALPRRIHACRPRDLPFWLGRHLWEIELAGEILEQERKVVAQRGRLLERLSAWTPELLDEFMDDLLRRTRRRFGAVAVAGGYVADIQRFRRSGASAWRAAAARAAERHAGPRAYDEERARQARWLGERLGLR